MSDKWPWYTEWSGIYMPFADALGAQLFTFVAILLLGTIGFLFYLLFKLVAGAFKVLGRTGIGRQLVYWLVPLSYAVLILCLVGVARYSLNQQYGSPQIGLWDFVGAVCFFPSHILPGVVLGIWKTAAEKSFSWWLVALSILWFPGAILVWLTKRKA